QVISEHTSPVPISASLRQPRESLSAPINGDSATTTSRLAPYNRPHAAAPRASAAASSDPPATTTFEKYSGNSRVIISSVNDWLARSYIPHAHTARGFGRPAKGFRRLSFMRVVRGSSRGKGGVW